MFLLQVAVDQTVTAAKRLIVHSQVTKTMFKKNSIAVNNSYFGFTASLPLFLSVHPQHSSAHTKPIGSLTNCSQVWQHTQTGTNTQRKLNTVLVSLLLTSSKHSLTIRLCCVNFTLTSLLLSFKSFCDTGNTSGMVQLCLTSCQSLCCKDLILSLHDWLCGNKTEESFLKPILVCSGRLLAFCE